MLEIDKSILILFGMIAGFVSIFLGYRLFLKGIEGDSTIEGGVSKFKLTLRNAAPGLFFALYGAFMILTGIYKQEIHSVKISREGDYEELISKGESARPAGYAQAAELQIEVLKTAVGLRASGDQKLAKILYYALLLQDHTNHMAHNNLANILLGEKNNELALVHARTAAELSEKTVPNPDYYDTLAGVLFESGNYQAALKANEKALSLRPDDSGYRALQKKIRERI
jgi:tetratricopeptide (TPR) repeat protein